MERKNSNERLRGWESGAMEREREEQWVVN
jgi:hypothetical protein